MHEAGPSELRDRAERYRRLKFGISDARAISALNDLADECEMKADNAEAGGRKTEANSKPSLEKVDQQVR